MLSSVLEITAVAAVQAKIRWDQMGSDGIRAGFKPALEALLSSYYN